MRFGCGSGAARVLWPAEPGGKPTEPFARKSLLMTDSPAGGSPATGKEDGAAATRAGVAALAGRLAGGGLLAASAAVHLDLYLTGYRSIPTIGAFFLFQVVAALLLAVSVVATRRWQVSAVGAGFVLATLAGYLLSVTSGLFGFREVRTTAGLAAGVVEVLAFCALAAAPLGGWADPGGKGTSRTSRAGRLSPLALSGTALCCLAAAALFAAAAAAATATVAPSARGDGGRVELEVGLASGTRVITNPSGRTLYWFALDSSSTSACSGTCATYWPPVLGRPVAGPGVRGRLGTIRRPGGRLQATFDGHPLYTYIGDTGRGTARGNGLDLNGGVWHELLAG